MQQQQQQQRILETFQFMMITKVNVAPEETTTNDYETMTMTMTRMT